MEAIIKTKVPFFEPTNISVDSFESEVKDLLKSLKVHKKKESGLIGVFNLKSKNFLIGIGIICIVLFWLNFLS